jgi:hypothetical protein
MSSSLSLIFVYIEIGKNFLRYFVELIENKKSLGPLMNINKMYKILKKDKITNPAIKDILSDVSPETFNISKKDPTHEEKATQLLFDIGSKLYFCVKDKGVIDQVILDRLDKLQRCESMFREKGYTSYIANGNIAKVTYNSKKVGSVKMFWKRNQFPTLEIKINDPHHKEQVERYGIPVALILFLSINKGRKRFEKIIPTPYKITTLELFDKTTDEILRGL